MLDKIAGPDFECEDALIYEFVTEARNRSIPGKAIAQYLSEEFSVTDRDILSYWMTLTEDVLNEDDRFSESSTRGDDIDDYMDGQDIQVNEGFRNERSSPRLREAAKRGVKDPWTFYKEPVDDDDGAEIRERIRREQTGLT